MVVASLSFERMQSVEGKGFTTPGGECRWFVHIVPNTSDSFVEKM